MGVDDHPYAFLSGQLVLGAKGGLTFGSDHFVSMLPFTPQKMPQPMLLHDLQLEENDTIDEVESSDDPDLEAVEAPVDYEEPKQPCVCERCEQIKVFE